MHIASLEAIPVSYPEPNDHGAARHLCLVHLRDSDGRQGWGEAVTMWPEASVAVAGLIEAFAPIVIGTDASDAEGLWASLVDHTWWYGRGGLASMAIAAIDIAAWDLRGQIEQRSLVEMLGGARHDSLPVIASGHTTMEPMNELIAAVASWVDGGLAGVKVGFGKRGDARLGYDHDRDVAFVRGLRQALGPDKLIMIDIGHAATWDLDTAIARSVAFDDYDIAWLEEPLGWHDPGGYETLRSKTRTKIAYGEREWTHEGVERILQTGTVDVVGLDPGRAEGISGFVRAGRHVEEHGRILNAHAWSSAIVTAASLAVSMCSAATWVFEMKPLPNPMQNELVTAPITVLNGHVSPLDGPGLGITVIPEVVDRYRLPNQ